MNSREARLTGLALLFLLLCFAGAQAQAEDPKGIEKQPYVLLPPDMMNRELTTIDNRRLRLADYPDKIIVIILFAPWCGPCIFNLKDLRQLQKTHEKQRIEIIGVVWNQNEPGGVKRVRDFMRKQKLNFQVVWDKEDFSELLQAAVEARAVIPQTFVVDKGGRIRKHFQGYNPLMTPKLLRAALDQLAKERETNDPAPSARERRRRPLGARRSRPH